jgi:5-methylcytosine-specific restriction endonuclease McrA
VLRVSTDGKRWRCKKCEIASVTARRIEKKKTLVADAGGQCLHCGYDGYYGALQFHHRDPADKKFAVSGKALGKSLEELREEAAKCDLLCSNCHSEVEYELALARANARSEETLIEEEGKLYADCPTHGRTEFAEEQRGPRCKRCRSEAVIRRRRKVKGMLIEACGGACKSCGYSKYDGALDFHHRDAEGKEFSLGSAGSISYERLLAEAQKCDLLCSNCHAEHHATELAAAA